MTDKELLIEDKNTGAIAVSDPLQRYLQEVHAYPMLKPEEERELALKWRDEGDIEAARKLVTTHLRLVAKIAMEYRAAYHNVLDLIQEGTVGLLTAVKSFDPDKGARLATYAQWWIRSFVLKYILDNFRLIKIGTTKAQKKLFYNLMREKQRIEAMGYYATPQLLSKELGVPERDVVEMEKRLTQPEYALEAPVKRGEGSEAFLKDFISDGQEPVDETLAKAEQDDILKQKLAEFAQGLKDREKKIFKERLLAELPVTLQEIADEYGITKERVRQIESRIVEKLKGFFEESDVDIEAVL
jgi:RNA polymerase sigma-32 factor